MDFGFSQEQELLRAEVRKLLDQSCPLAEVRKLAETPEGFSRPLWRRIAELGWVGLPLPEEHGGAGLGWLDLVVVLEETGRTLFSSPLVSCVLAATAIARAGDAAQRARWLPALASGSEIAALVLPEAECLDDPGAWPIAGEPSGAGFALRGEARFAADAAQADRFVVAFRAPEGPALGVLARGSAGLAVEPHALLDATRRAARLTLDGAQVPRDALLGRPGGAQAEVARLFDCGALAVSAEASGAAEAALALAVAHAKSRVQFGQPIGRFQGVKHPLAEMLVEVESLKSLLYYAAWLLDRDAPERALAVSRAKACATEAFARIGIECVQIHGAIGYTWECDAQLYLKRAKWTRPAFGDAAFHLERIARLGGALMDFDLTPEEEAFRAEVRAFLDARLPPESERGPGFAREWQRAVREKRWVGFAWPREVGGGGGTLMQQVILKQEMAQRRAPPLGTSFMGLAWVGPAIIQYGTPEQQQRFIPDILDGKVQWCTGYSEPGVGSDLAALRCRGVREGDEYVVTGQKIWTSVAMWAQWMILLVRTDFAAASKHDGITCLLVAMGSPGIEVRPIRNMSGTSMFAEVFFDGVRVPVANRLGEEGRGWQVTVSALANERSSIAEVYSLAAELERLRALARGTRRGGRAACDDPALRARLARADLRIEAMRLNGMRFLTKQLRGEPLGAETSIQKLLRAALEIELGELGLEIEGREGTLAADDPQAPDGGHWQRMALSWPEVVIGGGTPNIQRNILAERVLGLPKD